VADWATISALATGGGTLALAAATFASVRSSNRSAGHVETVPFIGRGGRGSLAISLRNVGAGIAVLQAWHSDGSLLTQDEPPADVGDFKPLRRDRYIAAGDVGIWQAALRDTADPLYPALAKAASDHVSFTVDLLYTDQVEGQRTISRVGVLPGEDGAWTAAAARHWYLDPPAPR
jgi:hypothetical protein